MKKQILSLNQKKEDLLVDLKTAILNLHQHLQQKQQELEHTGAELQIKCSIIPHT